MVNKDNIYIAPSEHIAPEGSSERPTVVAPDTTPTVEVSAAQPTSIEDVIAGLRGFGIEENEEILTFTGANGKKVSLRITNLPTEDEVKALLSTEDLKGYAWVQRIRVEILSRSISWIDGTDIRTLRNNKAVIKDADGVNRDIQVVLRNVILGWGQELVTTLWKIAMVHSDKLEKRYQSEFPDSVIMTEVERRFMENVMKEIEDSGKEIIADSVQHIFEEEE